MLNRIDGMRILTLTFGGSAFLIIASVCAAKSAPPRMNEAAPSTFVQLDTSTGNLPAGVYRELRARALSLARPLAGTRQKNPSLALNGLDPAIASALAEERAYFLQAHTDSAPTRPAGDLASLPSGRRSNPASARSGKGSLAPLHLSRANPSEATNCSSPRIRSVNGRRSGAVFTPAEPDNHYRIEGCAFGSIPGAIRLQSSLIHLHAGDQVRELPLRLETSDSWRDDRIEVNLDSNLNGLPDFTADLIVQLANGRQVRLRECLFIAARGAPQLLRTIPAAWVKLDATSASMRPVQQVEYVSPPVMGKDLPPDVKGATALVVRSDTAPFGPGKDIFDFSRLAPGWVIESVQVSRYAPYCPGGQDASVSGGSWATGWDMQHFTVAWGRDACCTSIPPAFDFNLSSSQYTVRVWVTGPLGTQSMRDAF